MSVLAPGGRGWLLAICASRVGAYMVYIAYAATLPILQYEWQLSDAGLGAVGSGILLHRMPEAAALRKWSGLLAPVVSAPAR